MIELRAENEDTLAASILEIECLWASDEKKGRWATLRFYDNWTHQETHEWASLSDTDGGYWHDLFPDIEVHKIKEVSPRRKCVIDLTSWRDKKWLIGMLKDMNGKSGLKDTLRLYIQENDT